jgi:S-adenosylmethionine synthetase
MVKNYLFTSESVSEGHPDKVADQISDAVLDAFLSQDPEAKVACESFCTTGMVVVMGEVRSNIRVDVETIARNTIRNIGYTKSDYRFDADGCGVLSALHGQSDDIDRGVSKEDQGAGDQGMMFGYACRETEDYMPLPLYLSHRILKILSEIRHNEPDVMPYLRPDSKSQFTVEYDGTTHKPVKVHTIVISTQHDQFDTDEAMQLRIRQDVENILIPRFKAALAPETAALIHDYELLVNPTGKFVIGGPDGDTGLTGRKIIVDTYGGRGAHGGGAFSGKDPSKVDRSAAYAARHIAKNIVAAGVADECLVQLAYAIGVAKPVSVFVDTNESAHVNLSDSEIAEKICEIFDLRPAAIIRRFGLKNPIYSPTAAYGHMGRTPYKAKVLVKGEEKEVQFFGWELLDMVETVRNAFGIK